MDQPVVSFDNMAQDFEEGGPIGIVWVRDFLSAASRGYMIKRARIFDPKRPCHRDSLDYGQEKGKT
jgi:hypothetical protein